MPFNAAPFAPGDLVRLAGRPDWGPGEVQSAVGSRITVTFRHGGKQLIDLAAAALEQIDPDDPALEPGGEPI